MLRLVPIDCPSCRVLLCQTGTWKRFFVFLAELFFPSAIRGSWGRQKPQCFSLSAVDIPNVYNVTMQQNANRINLHRFLIIFLQIISLHNRNNFGSNFCVFRCFLVQTVKPEGKKFCRAKFNHVCLQNDRHFSSILSSVM